MALVTPYRKWNVDLDTLIRELIPNRTLWEHETLHKYFSIEGDYLKSKQFERGKIPIDLCRVILALRSRKFYRGHKYNIHLITPKHALWWYEVRNHGEKIENHTKAT